MFVAVLSDIHDNIWNLEKVLKEIKEKNAESIIFCGDMCAPFTSGMLSKAQLPTYLCLGNNDEDQIMLQNMGGDGFTWTGLADEYGQVNLNNKKISFCHYPKLAELLAKTEEYDAVFHGHTHNPRNDTFGKTLLVNPGAICGIQGGETGKASYAIYNTEQNTAEIIELT